MTNSDHEGRIFWSHPHQNTVSHFSYAPLIKWKLLWNWLCYFYSETTSVKHIYICISHWNFIVIKWEKSGKMDLEGHYPQNTIPHCIISNESQITLHFFQGRISAMPEIRADLLLAVSKTGMCLLTLLAFWMFYYFVSQLTKVWKKVYFMTFFKVS